MLAIANNRMILVCNKCYPIDDWKYGDDVCYIGKWYPIGSYSYIDDTVLGQKINEYMDRHSHDEDVDNDTEENHPGIIQNENPIRLTYEHWANEETEANSSSWFWRCNPYLL